jgi:ABC-type transport system involved in Fe-S cluster assembly fused permease/ATPase subunit
MNARCSSLSAAGKPELELKDRAMATSKQKAAARRNVRKAAKAAKEKKAIAKLPKRTCTALGKQGAKVARQKR